MRKRMAFFATALLCIVVSRATSQPRNDVYVRLNLVSDLPAHALVRDPNLVNPWGIAFSATGPFWISDNHTGVSTVYNGAGRPQPSGNPLVVTIPPAPGGTPPGSPTGIVFNPTPDFTLATGKPAVFIFATEDGSISAWNPSVDATNAVFKGSRSGAVYKGLALGNNGSANFLYATNFHDGTIDVYDANFAPASLSGSFADPTLPAGFAPFGIRNIAGKLLVTYALQDADKHDDVPGPGNGFVDVFDTNGHLITRLISGGALNSPWGLAIAPNDFGALSRTLLVGNFGDGTIHGYDPSTGTLKGTMLGPLRRPLSITGLWGLIFGNGGQGGDSGVLYFTAGIAGPGQIEDHGLFGEIRPAEAETR